MRKSVTAIKLEKSDFILLVHFFEGNAVAKKRKFRKGRPNSTAALLLFMYNLTFLCKGPDTVSAIISIILLINVSLFTSDFLSRLKGFSIEVKAVYILNTSFYPVLTATL